MTGLKTCLGVNGVYALCKGLDLILPRPARAGNPPAAIPQLGDSAIGVQLTPLPMNPRIHSRRRLAVEIVWNFAGGSAQRSNRNALGARGFGRETHRGRRIRCWLADGGGWIVSAVGMGGRFGRLISFLGVPGGFRAVGQSRRSL